MIRFLKSEILHKTNFINEIVWCYIDPAGRRNTNYYKKTHDVILWYAKNRSHYKTNKIARSSLSESTIKRYKSYFNDDGQLTYANLKETNPGAFKSLKSTPEDLNKVWLDINKGTTAPDWWDDIPPVKRKGKGQNAKEKVEWSTKKPLRLLERIIETVTEKGDIVADFFCGCGTTIIADQGLSRKWIGCDASKTACDVMKEEMISYHSLFVKMDEKPLSGKDFKELPALEFEKHAV